MPTADLEVIARLCKALVIIVNLRRLPLKGYIVRLANNSYGVLIEHAQDDRIYGVICLDGPGALKIEMPEPVYERAPPVHRDDATGVLMYLSTRIQQVYERLHPTPLQRFMAWVRQL